MSARSWHLVAYDVRDDRRLRQIAQLLEGYGERIQYSVFRCRLTPLEQEKLRWELIRLAEAEDDWMILPLCASCLRRVRLSQPDPRWNAAPPRFTML